MSVDKKIQHIQQRTGLHLTGIQKVLMMLEEGNTIPFMARYRKEVTGSMDEVQLKQIADESKKWDDLESRKETIIAAITEQNQMTNDLLHKIRTCYDAHLLEDLYSPYKKKRKTKADVARESGLEPLAKIIMAQNTNLDQSAKSYLSKEVKTVDQAISMASDIAREWISEGEGLRERFRETFRRYGTLSSSVAKGKKEEAQTYRDYFDSQEKLDRCPSHRFLALLRGEQEGLLKLSFDIDQDRALAYMEQRYVKRNSSHPALIEKLVKEAYRDYILPSVENQIRKEYKEKADKEAIQVFAQNVAQLLLAAPLGNKAVLAIDPGFRTGCKVAALDESGTFLADDVIYPVEPHLKYEEASNKVNHLLHQYQIRTIAIGNGTASRETKAWLDSMPWSMGLDIYMVSENGASIYSASDVAREEFPSLDVTVRGAISIGRRLLDPLAELVKIDPKSIGVGQYQHDVNQYMLKDALDHTVSTCVNKVGIDLNTASAHLCTYVSGVGPGLAKNIISYREEIGGFTQKSQLLSVPRLGQRAFEQCAGFFRIRNGVNSLDNTGIHPESYHIVQTMAQDLQVKVEDLLDNNALLQKINPQAYVTTSIGQETITDILKELAKPGHDPRGQAEVFEFDKSIKTLHDLKIGMRIPGIITNMTNFGAFVDVGIKQDGLIHISQISEKRIHSPMDVLSIGQHVYVSVLEVDIPRNRVNLSLK